MSIEHGYDGVLELFRFARTARHQAYNAKSSSTCIHHGVRTDFRTNKNIGYARVRRRKTNTITGPGIKSCPDIYNKKYV